MRLLWGMCGMCDFGILLWLFCIVYVQYGYTLQYVGTMDLVELCPRRM